MKNNKRINKLRKIVSTNEEVQVMHTIEVKRDGFSKKRARSGSYNKPKGVKFAEFIDLEDPDIETMFQKHCECPGILIVDDQYINRYIIQQYAIKYNVK